MSIKWDIIGYIKRSKNRQEAMKYLGYPIMPSELAKKMNISLTHASKIIRELNSKKVIHCLNENLKVGRIYQLTEKGKKIREEIEGIK